MISTSLTQPLSELVRLAAVVAQCPKASLHLSWTEDGSVRQLIVGHPGSREDENPGHEVEHRLNDGTKCTILLWGKVAMSASQEECLDLLVRQATGRLQAIRHASEQQRMIVQTAKLSALGEMAAGIAHEINNPLAIIQGHLNKMRTLIDGGILDSRTLMDSVLIGTKTVVRLGKIVDGLRNFARDGEGEPFQRVDIFKIVDDTLALCQERFKNQGVSLRVHPIARDLMIECRQIQVSQVLLNLLLNSFDAVSGLAESWVELKCIDQEDSVEILITDSGRGISGEIQQKMFQPFFSTKNLGQGTGLGLSISKGIVESHEGRLSYRPEFKNTCFSIRLPKVLCQKEAKAC